MPEFDGTLACLIKVVRSVGGLPEGFMGTTPEDDIIAAECALGVVFPASYRAFLRYFGAGTVRSYPIYGLPNGRLWGDVVMMNHLASRPVPGHYVKFTEDSLGRSFYLDTSRRDAMGECPVIGIGPEGEEEVVADGFLHFLREANEKQM